MSDLIKRNKVKTVYLETVDVVADGLTKPLQGDFILTIPHNSARWNINFE